MFGNWMIIAARPSTLSEPRCHSASPPSTLPAGALRETLALLGLGPQVDVPSDSLGTPPMHVPNYLCLEVAGADALIFALCPVKAPCVMKRRGGP